MNDNYESEDQSVNELRSENRTCLHEYAEMLTAQLCEDSNNDKEFRDQIKEEIRRNKAAGSAYWFKEIDMIVDLLTDKGYEIDEAIHLAVRERKFMLKKIFTERKNMEPATRCLENNIEN